MKFFVNISPTFPQKRKTPTLTLGSFLAYFVLKIVGAEGGTRTHTPLLVRILSPSRLPFRHLGSGISCLYFRWRRRADSNRRIEVLQTSALVHLATSPEFGLLALVVPRAGLEPTRAYAHGPLKTACLPIPPPRPV